MEYNATVEFDGDLDETAIDRVMDELQPLHVALGWCPDGRPHVTLTLDAAGVNDAMREALHAAQAAVGRPARSIEALPTADFDRRHGISTEVG